MWECLYVIKEYLLEAMVNYSYKQACKVYSMQYTTVVSIQWQKEKCMNTNMKKYHARLMCHKNLEILRLFQKTKLMVKFIEVLVVFIRQTKVIIYQKQKICTLNWDIWINAGSHTSCFHEIDFLITLSFEIMRHIHWGGDWRIIKKFFSFFCFVFVFLFFCFFFSIFLLASRIYIFSSIRPK